MALSNTTEFKPASPSAHCPPNPASKRNRAIGKVGRRYRLRLRAIETAQHVQRQADSATMTWHTREVDGLDRSFTVTATAAYVDTIALFHPGMFPSDQLSWLRTRFGRRMFLKSCKGPGNAFRGGLITLHQPDVETLERLIAIPKKQFVLSAAHIAVDFICSDQGQAKLAAELLGRATVQKWHRRNHHSHREKNTHYLRRGGSTRNIAVYGDRDSKTGEGPCCHVEMRFTGADACRRAGLDLNKLFDGLDALRLLESQARIAPIDPKKLDRGIERKACRCLRGTQRRHPEITVGELKAKIWALVTRILQDEDSSFDEQTIDQARSQSLFDYRTDLRSSLDEILWPEFAPPARWHAWR
jgi:hypothetical protein